MNDSRHKSHPTTRIAVLIVAVVLIAIATLLFNAIKGKREYDQSLSAGHQASVPAASGAGGSR